MSVPGPTIESTIKTNHPMGIYQMGETEAPKVTAGLPLSGFKKSMQDRPMAVIHKRKKLKVWYKGIHV